MVAKSKDSILIFNEKMQSGTLHIVDGRGSAVFHESGEFEGWFYPDQTRETYGVSYSVGGNCFGSGPGTVFMRKTSSINNGLLVTLIEKDDNGSPVEKQFDKVDHGRMDFFHMNCRNLLSEEDV